jgi:hypothetical protein
MNIFVDYVHHIQIFEQYIIYYVPKNVILGNILPIMYQYVSFEAIYCFLYRKVVTCAKDYCYDEFSIE